ncbi:MAG: hypothetical protein M5R40_28255 [Anaerolineae bacterium]|nr:hypothetical protein [Anaerolineae bacterium]
MNEGYVRVRYRFGDAEMEAEGPPDRVEQYAGAFLTLAAQRPVIEGEVLKEGDGTLLLGKSGNVPSKISDDGGDHQSLDLCGLYRKLAPRNQAQQLMVINRHHEYEGTESLTVKEYLEAYSALRRVGVSKPANIYARLNEAIQAGYLYEVEEGAGQYALTDQGREFVDSMGQQPENGDNQPRLL